MLNIIIILHIFLSYRIFNQYYTFESNIQLYYDY